MGGNAIQGACRINRDEYDALVEKVKSKIIEVDRKFRPTEIKFFKSKKDFGDLDLPCQPKSPFLQVGDKRLTHQLDVC